jgi:hypothetical protein
MGLWCIGGSAYVGIGGGAKVCCTWSGCSACVEVGLGLGAGAQIDSGGLDHTGASVGAEAKAKCGELGVGAGVDLDTTGCLHGEIEAEAGIEAGEIKVTNEGVTAKERIGPEETPHVGVGGCKLQAKVRAKLCGG